MIPDKPVPRWVLTLLGGMALGLFLALLARTLTLCLWKPVNVLLVAECALLTGGVVLLAKGVHK